MSHIEKKISWLTRYGKYIFASVTIVAFSLVGSTQIKKVPETAKIDGNSNHWSASLANIANAGDGADCDVWSGDSSDDTCGDAPGGGSTDDCSTF